MATRCGGDSRHGLPGRWFLFAAAFAASLFFAGGSTLGMWLMRSERERSTERMLAVNDASGDLRVVFGRS
jgi:hypothetical protein